MNKTLQRTKSRTVQAQALVEFAIAIPILLVLLVGILETGRMLLIYTAVTNASREAARYASAVGQDTSGYYKYKYCKGIRDTADKSIFLVDKSTVVMVITYDHGPGTTQFAQCNATAGEDSGVSVTTGDRVKITIQADYKPMLKLIPFPPRTFISSSSRTYLATIELEVTSLPSNTPRPATLTFTPSMTFTPTETSTITPTPTKKVTGSGATFTPLPSSTPTIFVSQTPTRTLTPIASLTPSITPTTVTGCGNITATAIGVNNKTMSISITNPNPYAVNVSNVQVTWNSLTGAASPNRTLNLISASLGSTTFWIGDDFSGSLTITPSNLLKIPGNGALTVLSFTFDTIYQNPSNNSITVNLSTPGCATTPIKKP